MTTRICTLIYTKFIKYGCGLLSFHVIWVLALPAQEPSNPRASSRNGKNNKASELKPVTSRDEDVQLGILVFALMVVCIAVSLALAVMSCVLKARTRQRDEMEARVEELQYILAAKVEEMKVHGAIQEEAYTQDPETEQATVYSEGSHNDTAQVTEKDRHERSELSSSYIAHSIYAQAAVLPRMYEQDSELATAPQRVPLHPSVPSYDHHSRDEITRTCMQEPEVVTPPHQVPLPPSIPHYDHSRGEIFTTSPEVFVTPMNDLMPSYGHIPQEPRLTQKVNDVGDREEHSPPRAAWLTDVIVESPTPESARPAKPTD